MRKENILVLLGLSIIIGAFVFYEAPQNSEPKEFETVFEGKIVEYPDKRAGRTVLIIEPIRKPEYKPGRVRVLVKNTSGEYFYGEHVKIAGKMKEPKNFADFNWEGYLAKEGVAYEIYYPKVEKIQEAEKDLFYFAFFLREKLQRGINESLLPPHSSLYSAMLLSDKGQLTLENKDSLANAGLSHIVAISGMHIAVIMMILFFLLLATGLWRQHASIIVLAIITFYIIMIGAPASAVRAGIMAGVLITAQLLGRPNSSWRALLFAAAVMVLFNPYIVRYDIGFQLSFLAVAGILLFFERIEQFLRSLQKYAVGLMVRRPVTKDMPVASYATEAKFGFISVIAVTLSAQVLAFPIIIYYFGSFSLASPITNLLVVPFLPVILISGFVSALGGMVGGVVASVLAAPAWLFSSYVWFVINLFN